MAYKTYPMPDDYPDYPNHFQIARYFDDYVDHFGAAREDPLPHRGGQRRARRGGVGGDGRRTRMGSARRSRYRAVLVANGHHWNPRWPEPAFPGSEEFEGEQIHVHHYREPDVAARQAGPGAGDRQLGNRHRRRGIADRREDLPGDAPRRLRHAQVPERQTDRRSRLEAADADAVAGAALRAEPDARR